MPGVYQVDLLVLTRQVPRCEDETVLRKIERVMLDREEFRCPGTGLPDGVYVMRHIDNPDPKRGTELVIRDGEGQKFLLLWGTEVDVLER